MSASLLQLKDSVALRAGVMGHPDFPYTRLREYINLAQRFVQAKLNGLGMKQWETSYDISVDLTVESFMGLDNVAGCDISATTFPNMLESPKSILYIDLSAGGQSGVAREVDSKRFHEQTHNAFLKPSVTRPIFTRIANKIYIAPFAEYTQAMAYYYRIVTDLITNESITEIPPEFEEYIIKKAVIDIKTDLGVPAEPKDEVSKQIALDYEKFYGKLQAEKIHSKDRSSKLQ